MLRFIVWLLVQIIVVSCKGEDMKEYAVYFHTWCSAFKWIHKLVVIWSEGKRIPFQFERRSMIWNIVLVVHLDSAQAIEVKILKGKQTLKGRNFSIENWDPFLLYDYRETTYILFMSTGGWLRTTLTFL